MSIQISRTVDMPLVRSIMTHPRIYAHLADDGSLPPSAFRPAEHPSVIYLLVVDESPLGVFMLVPHNTVCYEVHTCMLPRAWGERAEVAARAGTEWMFEHTSCRRIITNVPTCNRLAERFARKCGMAEFGRNPKSFLKGGALYDQILLGISKEDE